MKKIIALVAALFSVSIVAHADMTQSPGQQAPSNAVKASEADLKQTPSNQADQVKGSSGDEASPENDKDPEADQ